MKTCPVCKTQVFDDMQSCFGCMHRFDDDAPSDEAEPTRSERRWEIEPRPFHDRGDYGLNFEDRDLPDRPSERPMAVAPREWQAAPVRSEASRMAAGDGAGLKIGSGPGIGVRLEVRVATDPAQVWSAELYPTTWPSAPS